MTTFTLLLGIGDGPQLVVKAMEDGLTIGVDNNGRLGVCGMDQKDLTRDEVVVLANFIDNWIEKR